MSRLLQYKLPGLSWKTRVSMGGSETKGHPRQARPVDTKQALHIVMRSSRAKGDQSLLAHLARVEKTIQRQAQLFGISIYECSTPGNHVHILCKVGRRKDLGRFLRSLSGLLARIALGAERGSRQIARGSDHKNLFDKFWDARPWTRIVYFGRDFGGVRRYLRQNTLEALGLARLGARRLIARTEALLRAGKIFVPGFG